MTTTKRHHRKDPCFEEGCPDSADTRLIFQSEDGGYVRTSYCIEHRDAAIEEAERDSDFLGTESG